MSLGQVPQGLYTSTVSETSPLTYSQELDLLLSSTVPSDLIPALPFVFSTPELHALSSSALERCQLPSNMQLTKLFWSDHVDRLKQELLSVRELGPAPAEEWLKGLAGRGTEQRQDFSRWEKYAISGGVGQMRTLLYPGYRPKLITPGASTTTSRAQTPTDSEPSAHASSYLIPTPGLTSAPPSMTIAPMPGKLNTRYNVLRMSTHII
jgi:hypothetical protein